VLGLIRTAIDRRLASERACSGPLFVYRRSASHSKPRVCRLVHNVTQGLT